MGTKTVKTPYQNTQTYQEWKPTETQDTAALRAMSPAPESLAPALQAQYDRAQEQSRQRYGSAYGQNIPEVTRRAMQGQEQRGLTQDYGAALSQSAYDANQANFARRMALAEMTIGRPLQSGSSGYQSQVAPSIWGQIIQSAGQMGAAAMKPGLI